MWVYEVAMRHDDRRNSFIIWGYSFKDACKKDNLNSNDLVVLFQDYAD